MALLSPLKNLVKFVFSITYVAWDSKHNFPTFSSISYSWHPHAYLWSYALLILSFTQRVYMWKVYFVYWFQKKPTSSISWLSIGEERHRDWTPKEQSAFWCTHNNPINFIHWKFFILALITLDPERLSKLIKVIRL